MEEKLKKAGDVAIVAWYILLITLFMYYIENNYFNMLEAKSRVVHLGMLAFIGVSTLILLMKLLYVPVNETIKSYVARLTLLDYGVLLFALAAIWSNVFTDYKEAALYGSYGWSVGTLWIVGLCFTYFFLSNHHGFNAGYLYLAAVCVGVELLWVCVNGFYVDPLGMHERLAAVDYPRYVGSIGNTNWYVGFVTMVLPFFLLGAEKVDSLQKRLGLSILLILATISAVTINCMGIYLGFGAVMAAYLCYSFSTKRRLELAMENIAVMGTGLGILALLADQFAMVQLDWANELLLKPYVFGVVIVVALGMDGFLKNRKEETYEKWKKLYLTLFCIILFFGGAIVLYTQVKTFDDSWGTNRGGIWKVAIKTFLDFPLIQKLFGGGTGCFGYYYLELTGSDWVRNAHNEYLEFLVTTGIVGGISYVGIYVGAWMEAVKRKNLLSTIAVLSLTGYAAQALVNNPQALNGAVFISILAMIKWKQAFCLL
ncbi:MAG: O-antigen ligase family protein [Lachnospiraceae bacterium]|nr:O-antigen ligase family protein [Lachnospiraceae bacterium]